MPSSHLILCHPLLLLPPIPPSIRVFSTESTLCMRWPKYWSFSFSIIPSKEHPGLISFRMDWLDLLAVVKKKISNQPQVSSKQVCMLFPSSIAKVAWDICLPHHFLYVSPRLTQPGVCFIEKESNLWHPGFPG